MAKTVKELKEKLIYTVGEIDASKLTLCDLGMVTSIVKVISEIHEESKNDFEYYYKLISDTLDKSKDVHLPKTVSELKEGE